MLFLFYHNKPPGPCGETFIDVTNDASGTLTSPGWPVIAYPNRAQCLWLIVAEVKYRIVLTFTEFLLEEPFDYLYCGDGVDFNDAFLTVTG